MYKKFRNPETQIDGLVRMERLCRAPSSTRDRVAHDLARRNRARIAWGATRAEGARWLPRRRAARERGTACPPARSRSTPRPPTSALARADGPVASRRRLHLRLDREPARARHAQRRSSPARVPGSRRSETRSRFGPNTMRLERVEPERVLAWRSEDGNWVWTFVLVDSGGEGAADQPQPVPDPGARRSRIGDGPDGAGVARDESKMFRGSRIPESQRNPGRDVRPGANRADDFDVPPAVHPVHQPRSQVRSRNRHHRSRCRPHRSPTRRRRSPRALPRLLSSLLRTSSALHRPRSRRPRPPAPARRASPRRTTAAGPFELAPRTSRGVRDGVQPACQLDQRGVCRRQLFRGSAGSGSGTSPALRPRGPSGQVGVTARRAAWRAPSMQVASDPVFALRRLPRSHAHARLQERQPGGAHFQLPRPHGWRRSAARLRHRHSASIGRESRTAMCPRCAAAGAAQTDSPDSSPSPFRRRPGTRGSFVSASGKATDRVLDPPAHTAAFSVVLEGLCPCRRRRRRGGDHLRCSPAPSVASPTPTSLATRTPRPMLHQSAQEVIATPRPQLPSATARSNSRPRSLGTRSRAATDIAVDPRPSRAAWGS